MKISLSSKQVQALTAWANTKTTAYGPALYGPVFDAALEVAQKISKTKTTKTKKRCKGLLFLENIQGILIRHSDGKVYGHCNTCKVPVSLIHVRRICNRTR